MGPQSKDVSVSDYISPCLGLYWGMCIFGVREFEDNVLKLICLACSLLLAQRKIRGFPKKNLLKFHVANGNLIYRDQLQED